MPDPSLAAVLDHGELAGVATPGPPLTKDSVGYHLTLMQAELLPVPPSITLGGGEVADGAGEPDRLRQRLDGLVAAAAAILGVPETAVPLTVRSSPTVANPEAADAVSGLGATQGNLGSLAGRLGSENTARESLASQAAALCRHVARADPDVLASATDLAQPAMSRWRQLRDLFTSLTAGPYPAGLAQQVSITVTAIAGLRPSTDMVIQATVYGTAAGLSGSGVVFSQDPVTGEPGLAGQFTPAAAGQSAGLAVPVTRPRPVALLMRSAPALFAELELHARNLHRLLGTTAEIEFVIERGRLWLTRVRPVR